MTKIIILSDTHGNRRAIDGMFPLFGECDMIIHLGDTSGDGSYIRSAFPDKTVVINGNCDFSKLGEDEKVICVEGVKIFATHGHLYGVKTRLSSLAAKAQSEGCSVALYGHSHAAREDVIDGITLINPGCMTRYGNNGYAYMVINGEKVVNKLVTLS